MSDDRGTGHPVCEGGVPCTSFHANVRVPEKRFVERAHRDEHVGLERGNSECVWYYCCAATRADRGNMGLLLCPDCRGQVSDIASACPHCGRPMLTNDGQFSSSNPQKTQRKTSGWPPLWVSMVTVVGLWIAYQIMAGACQQNRINETLVGPNDIGYISIIIMAVVFFGIPIGFWMIMRHRTLHK